MKFKNRIRIIVLLPVMFGITIIAIQQWTNARVDKTLANQNLITRTTLEVSDLYHLSSELARYPGELRPEKQWLLKYKIIQDALSKLRKSDNLAKRISQSMLSIKRHFDRLQNPPQQLDASSSALRLRNDAIMAQMQHLSQDLMSNSLKLQHKSRDSLFEVVILEGRVILVITFLLVLMLSFFVFLMGRQILGAIRTLKSGAEIIGEGDLTYRIKLDTRDELSDLGSSINNMTRRLQQTLASRDHLNKEVEERKKIEKKLTEFKDTLDRTLDCIFIFDPETLRFSYLNQGAVSQVGYSASELKQMTPFDIKPEFDEASFREMMDQAIHNQSKKLTFNTVHKHKNGSLIPVEESLQYIELEEGNRFVAVVRDISEQLQVSEELRKLNEELEQRVEERTTELKKATNEAEEANRAKGVFISNMSHEFRTPLNAVIGFSQQMMEDQSIKAEHREYLNIIKSSGLLQLSLINDVLSMSSLDDGQSIFIPKALDLSELLKDVIDKEQLSARDKNISFKVVYESDVPQFIYSDHEKLQQIFIHVIDNAIKYTELGGVTVYIGSQPSVKDSYVELVCDVVDTGIGIHEEFQQRIFLPFVQVGEQDNKTGTGLGLTLVQRFLQLMGGEISVDSELGKGSKFHITLPVKLSTEADFEPKEQKKHNIISIEPDGNEYRVLVVDDNEEGRVLLKAMLEDIGFSVRVASSGELAIEIFKEWHPQMIWMDMHMAVMDGMEATRRIRALEGGSETKIAALTAYPLNEIKDKNLQPELDDFLLKPFHKNEMLECMGKHLGLNYQYEEKNIEPPYLKDKGKELCPEDLDILDSEALTELVNAVLALDVEHSRVMAEHIGESAPDLGKTLLSMVNNLDFDGLQKLLKNHHR